MPAHSAGSPLCAITTQAEPVWGLGVQHLRKQEQKPHPAPPPREGLELPFTTELTDEKVQETQHWNQSGVLLPLECFQVVHDILG